MIFKTILSLIAINNIFSLTPIRPTITSLEGDRHSQYGPISWKLDPLQQNVDFKISTDNMQKLQQMDGFGASFNEAGSHVLNQLSEQDQDILLQFVFEEIGFSAMKVPIASTDFASNGPWFTYDDTINDHELKDFQINRDLEPDGVLTFIKKAQKYGKFMIESCADFPPDWMLVNSEVKETVQQKYYGALAEYFLNFVQAYDFHGVTIDIMAFFNEPWDSYTKIPIEQNLKFLSEYAGPLFRKASPKTLLTVNEMPDRNQSHFVYTYAMQNYPDAHEYLDIFLYHGYDCQFNCTQEELNFNLIGDLKSKYPDKHLWMTELCYAYEFGQYPPPPEAPQLPRADFMDGFTWANVIYSDIEVGASAWIYWNMILNETGGPWMIYTKTKEVTYTGGFWFLSHFSRFVKKGMYRINIEKISKNKNIRALAFMDENTDKYIINVMNTGKEFENIIFGFNLNKATVTLPPYSITTLEWSNSKDNAQIQ